MTCLVAELSARVVAFTGFVQPGFFVQRDGVLLEIDDIGCQDTVEKARTGLAQFLMPIAISISFGVVCATGMMLPLIPFLFAHSERVYSAFR